MYICKVCLRKESYCNCLYSILVHKSVLFSSSYKKKFRNIYLKYKVYNCLLNNINNYK